MIKQSALILATGFLVTACKIQVDVPPGGSVDSLSGSYDCQAGKQCEIDVVDIFFDEEFRATAADGFQFEGWERRDRGLCGGSDKSCRLTTSAFEGVDALLAFLADPEETFFLTPSFLPAIEQFSRQWLAGRTLYSVALVGGGDEPDFAEVVRFEFGEDGIVRVAEILNDAFSDSADYAVTEDGLLYFGGEQSQGIRICEVTADYFKAEYLEDGEYDNTELLFFDREAALAFGATLTDDTISRCGQ